MAGVGAIGLGALLVARRALVSAGSARCTSAPTARSSSTTNRQPVVASNATSSRWPAKRATEPTDAIAVRRRDPRARDLARHGVQPVSRDLRPMLVQSHYDGHPGPPREHQTRRTRARSWPTRRSGRHPAHAIFARTAAAASAPAPHADLPQRDSDDFELGPTDSSRAVDVVPMHWMQRGRVERRFCCSSRADVCLASGEVLAFPPKGCEGTFPGHPSVRPTVVDLRCRSPRRFVGRGRFHPRRSARIGAASCALDRRRARSARHGARAPRARRQCRRRAG